MKIIVLRNNNDPNVSDDKLMRGNYFNYQKIIYLTIILIIIFMLS